MLKYENYTGEGVFVPQFCTFNCPTRSGFEDWLLWAIQDLGEDFLPPDVYACEPDAHTLCAYSILENSLDDCEWNDADWPDGAREEFQKLIDEWNGKYAIRYWTGSRNGPKLDISDLIARLRKSISEKREREAPDEKALAERLFSKVKNDAILSECERYRFALVRRWSEVGDLHFVMLNPSKADAEVNDPTIRRCLGFAKRWGYGGLVVTNLFALRSTSPRALYEAGLNESMGPWADLNFAHSWVACQNADFTIVAWGNHGGLLGSAGQCFFRRMRDRGRDGFYSLGVTKSGQPKHPLYLPNNSEAETWMTHI